MLFCQLAKRICQDTSDDGIEQDIHENHVDHVK